MDKKKACKDSMIDLAFVSNKFISLPLVISPVPQEPERETPLISLFELSANAILLQDHTFGQTGSKLYKLVCHISYGELWNDFYNSFLVL